MGVRGRNFATVTKRAINNELHKMYVELAYRWVMNNTSCGIAFKELKTANTESPDVIGFGSWGHSVLVEVKVNRGDFLSDKNKFFRKHPEKGMGSQRFYFCPKGLISKEELPAGWGLVWVGCNMKARIVYSPYKGNIGERCEPLKKNIKAEHIMMYSALRRLHLRGLIDLIYEPLDGLIKHQ